MNFLFQKARPSHYRRNVALGEITMDLLLALVPQIQLDSLNKRLTEVMTPSIMQID
jgi:hypothetical protein